MDGTLSDKQLRNEAILPTEERAAEKMAERLVSTLIQTYLSPAVIEVLRNSIMAGHEPQLTVSFIANHLRLVDCKLIILPYEEPHAEAFPLQITIQIKQGGEVMWRKLFTAINGSETLNRHYTITGLDLDVNKGAVSFWM